MKRFPFIAFAAALAGCGPGGPVVTEPMPDIPETVEYETIRIEYGDDDLVGPAGTGLSAALVGDASTVAALARGVIKVTNGTIRGQIRLIDAVTNTRPTEFEEGLWIWDNAENKGPDDAFSRFEIREGDDGQVAYEWHVGPSVDERLLVFSGEYSPRQRADGAQRGSGLIRFDFDNIREIDPDDGPVGKLVVAFRSVAGIRQVRIAALDFAEPGNERENALSEYVQFRDGRGRFKFATRVDFLQDGEPKELMSIDAIWNRDSQGRSLVRVSGGSLEVNEVLLEECWSRSGRIEFADLTPDLPFPYEDGTSDACGENLLEFPLAPGEYSPPEDEPAIPGPHPDEEG